MEYKYKAVDCVYSKRKVLSFLLVIVVTLFMFHLTFDDYFFASDFGVIEKVKGLNISNFWRAEEFTSEDAFWWWEKGLVARYVRPVEDIIRHIDFRLWGLDATGYHVTSVLLHLFNVIIFTSLAYEVIKKKWAALIASLIFALHPCHNESIMFIAARPDLTASLFYLASFTAYLKFRQKKWKWAYPLTIICLILALLSKEMAVTLPIVLFLYDFIFNRGDDRVKNFICKNLKIFFPIFTILALYLISYFLVFGKSEGLAEPYFQHPLKWGFISNSLIKYLFYFVNFMIINFFHPMDNIGFWFENMAFFIPFLIVAIIFYIIVFKQLTQNKWALFFFIWILVTFLPVMPIIMSQRAMYIPSIGFCMILGLFFERFPKIKKFSSRGNRTLIVIILTIIFSYYTVINYFTINTFGIITKSVKKSLDQIQKQLDKPPSNSHIIFINSWVVMAGCLSHALRLLYDDPSLKTHVLTIAPKFLPDNPINSDIKPLISFAKQWLPEYVGSIHSFWRIHDNDTIVVEIKDDAYFSSVIDKFLLWGRSSFKDGEVIKRDEFDVIINEVNDIGVKKLTFRFHSPITNSEKDFLFVSNGFIIKREF